MLINSLHSMLYNSHETSSCPITSVIAAINNDSFSRFSFDLSPESPRSWRLLVMKNKSMQKAAPYQPPQGFHY